MLLRNLPERQVVVRPVRKQLVIIASDAQADRSRLSSCGYPVLGVPFSLAPCSFGEVSTTILDSWGYTASERARVFPIALCESSWLASILSGC